MKRIILAIALLAAFQFAGAQQAVKTADAAKAQVQSAKAATENPKKAANPVTWIKLGQAYCDAYNAAQGNGWIGATKPELQIVMGKVKGEDAGAVEISGAVYALMHYPTADYYFNPNGQLQMIVITKPVIEDALQLALEAYKKAYETDAKGKKVKDIVAAEGIIQQHFIDDAYNSYTLGDFALASKYFELAAEAAAAEPKAVVDSNSIYNAGLTAWMVNDIDRAKVMFERCAELGYYADDGEVFAKLSEIADKKGDKETSVKYLEEGFVMFPKSQSILVGLINYYIGAGTGTDRLFELLDVAKQNEPTNASLWYVEGDIRLKMDPPQVEEAFAAYDKCSEINPDYEFGYIGKGVYLYNRAVDLQEKASYEMDDAKYMALVSEFEQNLKACIGPFEKVVEITKDNSIRTSVAEYLKNACFRFRTDPEYQAKYDKYSAIAAGN